MSDSNQKKQDQVLDHNYDGIQEYDNDLPRWWLMLFWGCIAFGGIYVTYFHFGPGLFRSQKLEQQMASIQKVQEETTKKVESQISEKVLLAFASDQANIDLGNKLYQEKCMACHAADGGGLIGPNLTDQYWIHGGSLMDIRQVIMEGVPEKGMISWKAMMSSEEIKQVIAYLHSLRGTTPKAPKEAQGEEFVYNEKNA